MTATYKQMTDFLVQLGIENIPHTTKSYLGHLIAVYRYLQERGCGEDACRAGMFHSIYGTEMFQGFKLALERRPDVRALIGERAERLAYMNCAMDRTFFDQVAIRGEPPYRFRDRITGEVTELTREDFEDLCRVHLHDWLEQVPRSQKWSYRRPGYRGMAERLGAGTVTEYDRVFAGEGG
jgi:hypothetical protein